jgi:septum formation protein
VQKNSIIQVSNLEKKYESFHAVKGISFEVQEGEIFGKPENLDDARRMLSHMSGRTHRVHTAISVVRGDRQAHTVDSASVTLVQISPELMDWYLATGESLDKAGAYALQGDGGKLVESVHGSFTTVVGLPLEPLSDLLAQCGLSWNIGA